MAGHSKWANIKHKKAKEDAKRAKVWTKIIREIVVAARMGGGDANDNPRLRMVLDKANGANMTKDVIDRAIKRGAGGGEDDNMEEVRYEGYGPAGVAVMVDCLTNNRNRTVAEVRHAFSKAGGNLGTSGSVAYLFSQQGFMMFAPGANAEKIMEIVLEAGGDDVVINDDNSVEVITSPDAFITVKEALIAAGFTPDDSEVTMDASVKVDITDKDTAEKVERLIDVLEDLDDVQEVYSNAEIDVEL